MTWRMIVFHVFDQKTAKRNSKKFPFFLNILSIFPNTFDGGHFSTSDQIGLKDITDSSNFYLVRVGGYYKGQKCKNENFKEMG